MQRLRKSHLGTLAQLVATERLLERVRNLVRDDVGTGLSGDGLLSTAHEARGALDVGRRVVVLCRMRLDAKLLLLLLAVFLVASEEVDVMQLSVRVLPGRIHEAKRLHARILTLIRMT